MASRKKFTTGTPSEKRVGYSRAVRSIDGKRLYVSGTTAQDNKGNIIGKSVFDQADYIFKKLKGVVANAGFSESDIVLVRAYLTDMKQISDFDRVFIKHFKKINPACTLVGISNLVDPGLLIEIECVADSG